MFLPDQRNRAEQPAYGGCEPAQGLAVTSRTQQEDILGRRYAAIRVCPGRKPAGALSAGT